MTRTALVAANRIADHARRGASRIRNDERLLPMPISVEVRINGNVCVAFIDSGSMLDMMSTTFADQLKIPLKQKVVPMNLQMAVSGSQSKVNVECTTDFAYQDIRERRTWDVANIDHYDIVLGTPFIWQHSVLIGMNPTRVFIGSAVAKPLQGDSMVTIRSARATAIEAKLEDLRNQVFEAAQDLFQDTAKTELPPLRAINHEIPLIDEHKVYPYRPSRCPEALRPLWLQKKMDYLNTSRWRYAAGGTCCPLMILPKPKS
ncbi:hypothetical protein EXIGLDRAFT_633571, partial [Exidia glandulosa HHB12029]